MGIAGVYQGVRGGIKCGSFVGSGKGYLPRAGRTGISPRWVRDASGSPVLSGNA